MAKKKSVEQMAQEMLQMEAEGVGVDEIAIEAAFWMGSDGTETEEERETEMIALRLTAEMWKGRYGEK